MDRNTKQQRKSLSLGNKINKRRNDQATGHAINEPNSPTICMDLKNNAEGTPPHKNCSLDESIEYSPLSHDISFSPSTMFLQSGNSEVDCEWVNKNGKSNMRTSDHALTDSNMNSVNAKETYTKSLKNKRKEQRRAFELKVRRAKNSRTEDILKRRCAQFNAELTVSHSCNVTKIITQPSTSSMTLQNEEEKTEASKFSDFFNDSDADNFLLEATEQVEHDIRLTQQTQTAVVPNISTPTSSNNKSREKRSSFYTKFLEDDDADDLFGNLDDIIAQAMQNTKPKNPFQRYNSMPVESMSPKTKSSIESNQQFGKNSTEENHTIKRHASSHGVQIYHPQKMKQIRKI